MSFLNICICGSVDEPRMGVVLDRERRGYSVRGLYCLRRKGLVVGNTAHIHLCYLV